MSGWCGTFNFTTKLKVHEISHSEPKDGGLEIFVTFLRFNSHSVSYERCSRRHPSWRSEDQATERSRTGSESSQPGSTSSRGKGFPVLSCPFVFNHHFVRTFLVIFKIIYLSYIVIYKMNLWQGLGAGKVNVLWITKYSVAVKRSHLPM